jgi:secondary thiamine-phosphate synthase enzyme
MAPQFIDITDAIETTVSQSGITSGIVTVFSKHTTAAIRIIENEPLLINDLTKMLEHLAPQGSYYQHNDMEIRTVNVGKEEPLNGHSHCQQFLLASSESIPVLNSEMQLGKWQRLFFVDLDGPRTREYLVQVIGA